MRAGESRLIRKLEGGWLGPVHIEERPSKPQVVVKKIAAASLQDPQARARLSALAAAQKTPADPGLVAVLSCAPLSDGGVAWEMPFVDGEDLAAYVNRQPAQAAQHGLWIGHEIARLLCVGESAGYHHGALRPSQVLISPNPAAATGLSVSLLGLGMMQALGAGPLPHVPAAQRLYLAGNEQASLAPRDGRGDVYALGVLLLQLLQGAAPTPEEVQRAASNASPLLFARAIHHETARLVQE